MSKLIIMRGLPASGKSTKAKELLTHGNTVRINRDLLRTMLHCDKWTGKNEGLTKFAARTLSLAFLMKGQNVIIDDTNLNDDVLQSWKDMAIAANAKLEYHDLRDVPVEECLARDRIREKRVGDNVIIQMALQYLDYWKGEEAVICDLDGTLCDIEHRRHHVRDGKKDWRSFFAGMSEDELRQDVCDKVQETVGRRMNTKLILVSARPEDYRKETEEWLSKNLPIPYDLLIMRGKNDTRQDTIVKFEIYEKFLKNLSITRVFDDRPSVIRMWKEKGLTVEDVGDGVEF